MTQHMSLTERRFRDGTDKTRYLADGLTIRCQAVSKTKLREIQEREQNFALTPDDVWPEAQCFHAAVQGKLVCGGRGGHGGGSSSVPTYDMLDFMPIDMRDMMREIIDNPQLLSRRIEIAQLVARIRVLYQRLADNEALGMASVDDIRTGLNKIEKGDIAAGKAMIQAALDAKRAEKEVQQELYVILPLLKDMTRTEMSTLKDMQQIITFDQMVAALLGIADTLKEALEEHVPDERTRESVATAVGSAIQRRFNLRVGAVLPEVAETVAGQDVLETERVDTGSLLRP